MQGSVQGGGGRSLTYCDPLFDGLANGRLQPDPKQSTAAWWDFTEAVRFWTDGKHANHGFMFHGGGGEPPLYMVAHTIRAEQAELRPVVMVVYEGAAF